MKKFIALQLLSLLLIGSCSKDSKVDKTTYQIINNMEVQSSTDPYLDGSIYEIIVFCYKGSDVVHQDNIDKVSSGGGKSDKIEVDPSYEKVKVSFKFLPPESDYYDLSANNRKYVYSYTLLKNGENNEIIIDGSTMVSSTPKNVKQLFKELIIKQ